MVAAPPATMRTTMVSPMDRDMPRMVAVEMPDSEAGSTTRRMVCQWVAPRARDASRSSSDTL